MNKKENPSFKRTPESYEKNRVRQAEYNKTEAGRAAHAKYNQQTRQFRVSLHEVNDADILEVIDFSQPVAKQIKDLCRQALAIRNMFDR